jgi:rare lipoprotein A
MFKISLRLSAALCGAALMLCCSHFANAKLQSERPAPRTVMGKASTYNPLRSDDSTAGGLKTASGENYNPVDWTAAIQTALRGLFKGIKFGKAYRPAFALVEGNKRSAVVRINDVGPLKPGRIIDLNERAMRYFDPAMTRGVVAIKITPLKGSPAPGPVNGRATAPAGAKAG